jgi:hypothetical protein
MYRRHKETSREKKLCFTSVVLFAFAGVLAVFYVVFVPKGGGQGYGRAAGLANHREMFEETLSHPVPLQSVADIALAFHHTTKNIYWGDRPVHPTEEAEPESERKPLDFTSRFPLGASPQKIYRGSELVELGVLHPRTKLLAAPGRGSARPTF